MLNTLRLQLVEPLTVGGYLLLLLLGIQLQTREAWLLSLGVILALAGAAWTLTFRRARRIIDTPTSKIASAAQGYIELVGRGHQRPDGMILSCLTGLPCVWYRFIVEQQRGNKWHRVNSGRSTESFILDDGSGRCLVDPEFAEVIAKRKETWIANGYRYTEWLLLPQARIYVIGQLSTIGGANANLDLRQDVSRLLAEWKQDRKKLLERYDLDGNGEIDEKEWMLARQQAHRDVRKEHRNIRMQSGTNILHKPDDGRLFLISDLDPMRLARRYRLWACFHVLALFASLATIAWMMSLAN
ncbi:MAG: GIDE domain-containing protein [Burkholderiales bacterium]|jgi:hypothetical protein